MMHADSPKPPARPEPSGGEPVLLSYATPRLSGVENPLALIVAYLGGGWLATLVTFVSLDPRAAVFHGGVRGFFWLGSISLFIAAIGATLFALTLTQRVFAPLRPRQRRSPWLALFASVAHIAATVGLVWLTFGSGDFSPFALFVAPLIFLAFPVFAGRLIRGSAET